MEKPKIPPNKMKRAAISVQCTELMDDGITISLHFLYFSALFFLTSFPYTVSAEDTITSTESLTPGQTLVSSNDVFQLGFFASPDNSSWYVGVWYKNIEARTYVWVANRDKPIKNSSKGVFKISDGGNLVVLDSETNSQTIWSSNRTAAANNNPLNSNLVAQILDNGNLVLREASDDVDSFLWQSFDYPTNTLLPDMKLGWDLNSGLAMERYLRSWKSPSDPSSGDFSFKLDFHGSPEIFLWNDDKEVRLYRSGPWNGLRFSGVPEMVSENDINFIFLDGGDEVTYSFRVNRPDLFSRLTVNSSGTLERFTWVEDAKTWSRFWYAPKDQCDDYAECGPYGICDTNTSPVCNCTVGFTPKNPRAWHLRSGKDGCVRQTGLNCRTDGFLLLTRIKLPQSTTSYVNKTTSLDECRVACLKNCSCTAYSSADISADVAAPGCVMWSSELLDMRRYAEGGQGLYVKLAASDIAAYGGIATRNNSSKSLGTAVIVGIAAASVALLMLGLSTFIIWKRKKMQGIEKLVQLQQKRQKGVQERSQDLLLHDLVISSKRDYSNEVDPEELELPLFDFNTIVHATNNFSDHNMLGQGGFGCVYKGIVEEGQVIAVKRLSKSSGQGTEEFKNELKLITRLQHRNLVRLLGCCIEMDEKMLVYEYMEHRGLDSVLFDKTKSLILNWQRRFDIICGVARGLLYLHQDSRFRIIHRDLKASNILLDEDMIPKISDFGMARIFGRDQVQANTRRVVGTYGYMSPEYAMDGLFSVKSDVFSFGVLILEIVSGKKNRGFYSANNQQNLLGHAWTLWNEGKGLELVGSSLRESYSVSEALRCIQVGLLCVQEHAEDRPVMSTVVLILGSETATMPQPKNPGFCLGRNNVETNSLSSKQDESCTVNQVTVTELDAR